MNQILVNGISSAANYSDLSGVLFYKHGVFTRISTNKLCKCDIEDLFYTVEPAPTYGKTNVSKGSNILQKHIQAPAQPSRSK